MAEQRKAGIAWTDTTWNPTRGCERVSPGCINCYAERTALRHKNSGYKGLVHIVNGHAAWTGEVSVVEHKIEEPLHWQTPKRVFVDSMSDLFHPHIPDYQRDRIVAVMTLAHQHSFQVLTKRAEIMEDYWNSERTWERVEACMTEILDRKVDPLNRYAKDLRATAHDFDDGPPLNIWLGVSIEDKLRLRRLDHLRRTEAFVRFVSFEPLLEDLGAVDLRDIHWAIIGGESGPNARPMKLAWADSLLRQCEAFGTRRFMKQFGGNLSDQDLEVCARLSGRSMHHPKGGDPAEWPESFRIREYPE